MGIGIGQIIGSGIMVLTGVVVGLTGHNPSGLYSGRAPGHLHHDLRRGAFVGGPVQRRRLSYSNV